MPADAQLVRREGRTPVAIERGDGPSGPLLIVNGPQAGQTVAGVVTVSGAVLTTGSIDKIELFIDDDGVAVNRAVISGNRPDVAAAFPGFAGASNWITSFLARNYLDGAHTFSLAVTESGAADPTIFGPYDINVDNSINQAPFGNLDLPAAGASANGSVPVLGWALDDIDVDHVDFLVDGRIWATAVGRSGVGNAVFGGTRPDVFAAFPDFPGPQPASLYSGFYTTLDTTQLIDGIHTISVRATDNQGSGRDIGSVTVQVMNNGSLLGPFGALEYPMDEATLICEPAIPVAPPSTTCPSPCFPGGGGTGPVPITAFPNVVRGWSLDVGARQDHGQVSYVELMLDGAILMNTRVDCVVSGDAFANCYGLNRPDIAQTHQGYVNAANSGFQFIFGLARDPFLGLFDIFTPTPSGVALVGFTLSGKHTLSIRAGDEEETVTEFGEISVDLTCDASTNPDRASFGNVDSPAQSQFVSGPFQVLGWAFDLDGPIGSVDVAVDGNIIATLSAAAGNYTLRRDDVPQHDSRVTTPFVGFAYVLDTTILGDSEHDLTVYANQGSHHVLIGRRKFVVFNNNSIKQ